MGTQEVNFLVFFLRDFIVSIFVYSLSPTSYGSFLVLVLGAWCTNPYMNVHVPIEKIVSIFCLV